MRKKSNPSPSGFKKAPQAPRRFKSPYILFSISKMQTYKRTNKNVKVTSLSSRISKEWKVLSDDERNKWRKIAEQDKKRYNIEKSLYKGPWRVKSEKPPKDPSVPKRPSSAFLNYSRTRRATLIREYPDLKNTVISKLLGQEWKEAPPEVRQPHIDREAVEREDYHRKISAWREQQRQNNCAAVAQQQSVYNSEQQQIMSNNFPFDSSTVSRLTSTEPYAGTAASLPIWGNSSSSMVESTPKSITPVATKVPKPWVSPSISWEKSNQEYASTCVQYSTCSVTPSPSPVMQRIVYQPILPSVPSLLPQPLSAQSRTVSRQDANTIQPHPWQLIASNATKTVTTSQLSTTEIVSPPPATIPVTPLIDTTPNKTTTDYQNIFFPTMFEEEEKYKSNMTSHCLNNAVRKF